MTSVLSASRQADRASRSVRHKLPIAPQSLSYARAEIEISPSNGNTLHLRHGAEETDDAEWSHPRAAELHHHACPVHAVRVRNPDRRCHSRLHHAVLAGKFSGEAIAHILQQTDIPKLATIIMIVLADSLLGLLWVIAGEAVIALLSGIAGYVLGNRAAPTKGAAAN